MAQHASQSWSRLSADDFAEASLINRGGSTATCEAPTRFQMFKATVILRIWKQIIFHSLFALCVVVLHDKTQLRTIFSMDPGEFAKRAETGSHYTELSCHVCSPANHSRCFDRFLYLSANHNLLRTMVGSEMSIRINNPCPALSRSADLGQCTARRGERQAAERRSSSKFGC